MKVNRLTTPEVLNEYIPYGVITNQISSQALKSIYIMPKIKDTDPWSDENTSIDFTVEYMAYRPLVSYNEVYHPGYSAQYQQYYQAANNPYNEGKLLIN
jgi:hypothetical protein